MNNGIRSDLHILEGKAAFIAMATSAISMLNENNFEDIDNQKAWDGLAWYIGEIEVGLREINRAINAQM